MTKEKRELLTIERVGRDTGEMRISAQTTEEIEIILTTIYGLLKAYIDDGLVTLEKIEEGIMAMNSDEFDFFDDDDFGENMVS